MFAIWGVVWFIVRNMRCVVIESVSGVRNMGGCVVHKVRSVRNMRCVVMECYLVVACVVVEY